MGSKPFRIGIVGCGMIAPKHVKACLLSDRVHLTVLVDPIVSRCRELAVKFGVEPRLCGQVSEALGDVDGVVIAAPNHLHRDLAVECLAAKVHVLIEKPLATTVADGEAICRASEESDTLAAVGYMMRFYEGVRLFRKLLRSDYFGEIHRFAYQMGSQRGWSPLSAYNLDRRAAGGGVLVAAGTHFLDQMLSWFGYPDRVALEDDSLGGPEANAVASFHYERDGSAFEGVARFSKTLKLPRGFIMDSEKGRVILPEDAHAPLRFRPKDPGEVEMTLRLTAGASESELPTSKDPFQLQLEDFVDACRNGTRPMVAARDGLESLKLIEELYANRTPMVQDWYASSQVEVPAG